MSFQLSSKYNFQESLFIAWLRETASSWSFKLVIFKN